MQTRLGSLAESLCNVAIGYAVSLVTQLVVFPWFGICIPISTNIVLGLIFTVVSIGRSYVLRRLFNKRSLTRE